MYKDTRYNKKRLEQTRSSVELAPHASPSPTAQPPMMNAGPFVALMNLFSQGMQHGCTQNTGVRFKSRLPLQLENFGNHGSNKLAGGGASETTEIADPEPSEHADDLATLETEMAIPKKAAWQKTAEAKEEKEAAAEHA